MLKGVWSRLRRRPEPVPEILWRDACAALPWLHDLDADDEPRVRQCPTQLGLERHLTTVYQQVEAHQPDVVPQPRQLT